MEYINPEIPEGINTTKEHPLKEFFILTIGVLGAIVIAVIILSLLAEKLAVYVPFSVEQQLIPDNFFTEIEENNNEAAIYLQGISDQLARQIELPEDMQFMIHYSDSSIENAYATLGGNIYIYQGLLDLLPNENAVAMVVAHEMSHVYHRHPIIAMGRGVVIGLLLSAISGLSGDMFVGQVVGDAGVLTLLTFNRDQEREADRTALEMLVKHYGHVEGADELFKLLHDRQTDEYEPLLFLSTHPLSDERIVNIDKYANEMGWTLIGETTPLPDFMQTHKSSEK